MSVQPPSTERGRPWRAAVFWLDRVGPLLALLAVYGMFALVEPSIAQVSAIGNVVRQSLIVATAAVGMTLVIIAAGIDLSVGSIIALSSVVIARLLSLPVGGGTAAEAMPLFWPVLAALGGVLMAGLCGWLNGMLITSLRVAPFIVTLGTMLLLRGLALGLAGSRPVNPPVTWLSALASSPPRGWGWLMLPPGAWMMLLLTAAAAVLLRHTRLGRHVVAVGSNEATARLCGVAVKRVKLFVYATSGAAAGLGGLMLLSRQGQGDPTAAEGYELDVIAAVVIGGGSLSGGEGSAIGTLVGALIMTVIRVGCALMGLESFVQRMVTGAVIVIAVAIDRLRHRRTT